MPPLLRGMGVVDTSRGRNAGLARRDEVLNGDSRTDTQRTRTRQRESNLDFHDGFPARKFEGKPTDRQPIVRSNINNNRSRKSDRQRAVQLKKRWWE
jgi:hypothetical protein